MTELLFYLIQTGKVLMKKTIYLSPTFDYLEDAQKALSKEAFFLFDIHQVLFHCKGVMPILRAFTKIQSKPKTCMQGIKTLFCPRTWNYFKQLYTQGNHITESYLDVAQNLPVLHSELLNFSNNIYKPHNGMYQLLTKLKEKHHLYLLSNIGNSTLERLKKEYPDYFALMTDDTNTINRNSNKELVWKPQQQAYTQALMTIEKPMQSHLAIFVDDKRKNVEAAHKAGLNVIYFRSYEQFKKDISTLIGM